jgi:multidrug efflux system membrane fusion protein
MRFFSILTAFVVVVSLYFVVFERDRLVAFAQGGAEGTEAVTDASAPADVAPTVSVVAMQSEAVEIDRAVLLRGRTEAMRQVEVRAETSGTVISEPLRRGALIEEGEELCRIDPGTRQVALAEAQARLAEALSRVPEAEARVLEAQSAVPAARARLSEAESAVPAARARLGEALEPKPTRRRRTAAALLQSRRSACATVIQLDPMKLVGFRARNRGRPGDRWRPAGARLASGARSSAR